MRNFDESKLNHNVKNRIATTYEHLLMEALSDPDLKDLAANGDCYALLFESTNRGITYGDASIEMPTQIRDVLVQKKNVRERTAKKFFKSSHSK